MTLRAQQLIDNPSSAAATVFKIAQTASGFNPAGGIAFSGYNASKGGLNKDKSFDTEEFAAFTSNLARSPFIITPQASNKKIKAENKNYTEALNAFIDLVGGVASGDKDKIANSVKSVLYAATHHSNKQQKESLFVQSTVQ